MKINGIEITAKEFAYDGCHKIYLIESQEQRDEADSYGYKNIIILFPKHFIQMTTLGLSQLVVMVLTLKLN